MPYIDKDLREAMIKRITDNKSRYDYSVKRPHNAGTFNYLISFLCHSYIKHCGLNYTVINQVIGILECVKLELYRMIAAPYENKKRMENGSVSDLDSNDEV